MTDKSIGRIHVSIKVFISVLLLILAFVAGIIFNQNDIFLQENMSTSNVNKGINSKIETKLIETHSTQYIEQTVEEVTNTESIPKEQVNLRNFANLAELINWLDNQKSLSTQDLVTIDTSIDCDDYANHLQRKALEDGYIMSFQVIDSETYNEIFKLRPILPDTLHAINLVLIENSAYYIEPQTGEIQFVAYLD